jgi:endonuclease-3
MTGDDIVAGLKGHFPKPKIELDHANDFELLIAVILSAQTTDKKVNSVTPSLFAKYPGPQKLARADLGELEKILKPLGFYRQKAATIRKCAQGLMEKFAGVVPDTIESLVQLHGVGRKTASAVMVNAFNVPAVVVDTHVIRVSTTRLKLSNNNTAEKIEGDLKRIFREEHWAYVSKALVLFGRYVCTAKSPQCGTCRLEPLCPFEAKNFIAC